MYCPLKFKSNTMDVTGKVVATEYVGSGKTIPGCQCDREECAWWVRNGMIPEEGKCAVREAGVWFSESEPNR